jgi:hypothetical protein
MLSYKYFFLLFFLFTSHPVFCQNSTSLSLEEDQRAIIIKSLGLVFFVDGSENSNLVIKSYVRAVLDNSFLPNKVFAIYNNPDPKSLFNKLMTEVNSEINVGFQPIGNLPNNEAAASVLATQFMQKTFSDRSFSKKVALGLSILPINQIPKIYENVQQFPLWILYTEKGQILLEGLPDIQSVLTKDGKFIEPLGVEEASVSQN